MSTYCLSCEHRVTSALKPKNIFQESDSPSYYAHSFREIVCSMLRLPVLAAGLGVGGQRGDRAGEAALAQVRRRAGGPRGRGRGVAFLLHLQILEDLLGLLLGGAVTDGSQGTNRNLECQPSIMLNLYSSNVYIVENLKRISIITICLNQKLNNHCVPHHLFI